MRPFFQQALVSLFSIGIALAADPCPPAPNALPLSNQIDGIAVVVRRLNISKRPQSSAAFNNPAIAASELSVSDAQKVFDQLAQIKSIPFKYPEDGCYARAYEMSRVMDKMGVTSVRAFASVPHTSETNSDGTRSLTPTQDSMLSAATKNSPKGYVEWVYHTAPSILVKVHGKVEPYILDPSLTSKPVPVRQWIQIMSYENPQISVTYHNRFDYDSFDEVPYNDAKTQAYDPRDVVRAQVLMQKYLALQNAQSRESPPHQNENNENP